MSTPENSFIQGVHKYVTCYYEKNNNPYRGGTPDVFYSGPSRPLWIEYKFIVLPKRPDTLIIPDLSPLQLLWLEGRHAEGRAVWVVVGCKQGAVLLTADLSLNFIRHGMSAAAFQKRLIARASLGRMINEFTGSSLIQN